MAHPRSCYWQSRLAHHGTPIPVHANLHGHRAWEATPLQHRFLLNCWAFPTLTHRQRAALLRCSPGTISHNIKEWVRKGVLNYRVTGRGRGARSRVWLQRGVTIPVHEMNKPSRCGVPSPSVVCREENYRAYNPVRGDRQARARRLLAPRGERSSMVRTYTRAQYDEAQAMWAEGDFSAEWEPWRALAARGPGIIYPPLGSPYDSWGDDHPSQRAMLIRAIRETPTLLSQCILATTRASWSAVLDRLHEARDEWRSIDHAEQVRRERDHADVQATPNQATYALKHILNIINDS